MDIKQTATVIWRCIKLLWRVIWGLLGVLGLIVGIDSGFGQFADHVKRSGILGMISRAVHALVIVISENLLQLLILIVVVAILAHLLVDKARERSKAEFQKTAKKKPVKKKAKK